MTGDANRNKREAEYNYRLAGKRLLGGKHPRARHPAAPKRLVRDEHFA